MGAGFSSLEDMANMESWITLMKPILDKHGDGEYVLWQLETENPEGFLDASELSLSLARTDPTRAQRIFWEFTEKQLIFGGINFHDPLLSGFALFPLAAGIAVALSQTCTAPLSRITILSQVDQDGSRRRTVAEQAARITGEQGFEALWRGNLVSVAHRLTFYGINLLAYLNFRTLLMSRVPSMELGAVALVSGGLAALTATTISHPLDTLTTRIAVQTSRNYDGALRTLCNICKDDGFGSLYAGISASLLGIVPSMAISFTVYNRLLKGLKELNCDSSPFTIALVCGGIAGLAATTATFPINVVQRRMQAADRKGVTAGRRGGIRQMLGEIIDKEGYGGLYRGIQPHCLKSVVGHATAFVTYEMVKNNCPFLPESQLS